MNQAKIFMNQMTINPKDNSFLKKIPLIQSLTILISGILISCAILIVAGVPNQIARSINRILPRYANYGEFKDISDYTNFNSIFTSQPRISFNNNARLLFVETSDVNCINCANFHGYNSSDNTYSYNRLLEEYVREGKMDYIFIDTLIFDSIQKHNSSYCVAEQIPRSFFEYKSKLYKGYGTNFDVNVAIGYAQSLGIDINRFTDCFNSNKYEDRVNRLNLFAQNILGTQSTPTFHIYRMTPKEIIRADGSRVREIEFTSLNTINGNVDFNLSMKPVLDNFVNQYN